MTKKYLIGLILFFSLVGCSSGDSNTTSNTEIPTYFGGLYEEQWYMEKNTEFYTKNKIDENAHIHPDTNSYKTYQGRGVKVAIIDDGFDVNHPEIQDNIIAASFVRGNGTVSRGKEWVTHTLSSDFHGSAVAGIIASKDDGIGIRGIAPQSNLILIKMAPSLSDSATIKLFQEAVDYGADIINCSWGSGNVSHTVREYINTISNSGRGGKGTVVVFASGNDDINIGNDEAGIENVIGVGATDGDNLRAPYSNYGELLDIVAPGGYLDSIATIDPLGTNGVSQDEYNRYNQRVENEDVSFIGTSASAPIVSGAIALLLEKNPNLTRLEIQEKLKSATDAVGENTPYIFDMVASNLQNPTISGVLGLAQYTGFKIKLTSKNNNTTYGLYEVSKSGDTLWQSQVTDTLPYGEYKIELIDTNDNNLTWAIDESFIIDSGSENRVDTTKRRSNFYGYGKINLKKLLQ